MMPATYFQVIQGKKVYVCMRGKEMRRETGLEKILLTVLV